MSLSTQDAKHCLCRIRIKLLQAADSLLERDVMYSVKIVLRKLKALTQRSQYADFPAVYPAVSLYKVDGDTQNGKLVQICQMHYSPNWLYACWRIRRARGTRSLNTGVESMSISQ